MAKFSSIGIIAANIVFFVVASGHPPLMFAFSVLAQISIVLLGLVKERGGWPFTKPRVLWPIALMGFFSATAVSNLWNGHLIDPLLLLVPVLLAILIAIVGYRRGWGN